MPLYEYECRKCGRLFEARRGLDEAEAPNQCPTCGATDPRRVFSTFSTTGSDGCGSSRGFT